MTFPQTELDALVELDLGGTWTSITDRVFVEEGIDISRGRPNEAGQVDPSECSLALGNGDGRFSPRNPLSPYYGLIGRNTPLRVSVAEGLPFLSQPKDATNANIGANDSAQLSITGDIDLRIDLAIEDWSLSGSQTRIGLASQYSTGVNGRAWVLAVQPTGVLQWSWSANGTNTLESVSTVPMPTGTGRITLRVTHDVDNGASGNTVTFYTGPSTAGPWTQLGDPVVKTGTTSIFNSSASVFVGWADVTTFRANIGRLYKFELRSGINGTVMADPDLTAQTPGDATFLDTSGSPTTWFVLGGSEITQYSPRFIGEVSAWPQSWDLSGNKVVTRITASGILRRLQQGASPIKSALTREFSNPARANIVDYWPCEDGTGTQKIASALSARALGSVSGTPEFASFGDYLASSPLPQMNDASFTFPVGPYSVTTETGFRMVLRHPGDGEWDSVTPRRIVSFRGTGTAVRWEVEVNAVLNDIRLRAYDVDNASILTSSNFGLGGDPATLMIDVGLTQDGADVDYQLAVFFLDTPAPGLTSTSVSGTLASRTVGKITSVIVGPGKDLSVGHVGHIALANDTGAFANTASAMAAHQAEPAGDRIQRLCAEEDIPFVRIGTSNDNLMGAQRPDTLFNLFQEAATADRGMLFEPRGVLGIGYRDIGSLYNQTAEMSLAYDSGEVADGLIPVDDDDATRNEIELTRASGTTYRTALETGPLSVQNPPDGVGRYDHAETMSLYTDEQLIDAANQLLHTGTVDTARYPRIGINLGRAPFGDNDTTQAALLVDAGSRIVVTGLPAWVPPDDISQIVQGYTERLESYKHFITFNCTPESPYRVAELDDDVLGHADTEGSELASDVTSTVTSLSVATTSGPIWTTDSGDLPFDVFVGGERITVTAISGASSPQTFTVTRSVNGVVKAHLAGAEFRLWQPMILGY